MAKSPVNFSKAAETWKNSMAAVARSGAVMLGGEGSLVDQARQQFASGGTPPATWSGPWSDLAELSLAPGELLIVFVIPGDEEEVLAALESGSLRGGVVLAVDEGSSATGRMSHPGSGVVRLSFSDKPDHWRRLFEACATAAGDHIVALGRRYPALRRPTAHKVIYRTAAQNALIGALFFIPGTDMPVMTLNQGRMVLSLAGIYGESIDKERAVELVGLVGAGFGLRALARALVSLTPVIGWVVKAGTAFTGTVALGYAAVHYFEMGAPVSTGKVVALFGSLRR